MDQRKNIKVPEHLDKTIKRAAYIALGISAVFWCVVFYGIYEATK